MTSNRLAIRADAGAGIGAGHFMRSLALADAWRRARGSVDWFCTDLPPLLADLLTARGVTRHDLSSATDDDALVAWGRGHAGGWVVVDGYGLGNLPAPLRSAGARVLIIDDTGAWPRYDCDVLVNQNPDAESVPYRTNAATRLLGPSFALIRDEFLRGSFPERIFHAVRRVLVSFGGHDAHGQTARVVRLLSASHPALAIDAVAGVTAETPAPKSEAMVAYHTTTNLSTLMRNADVAVVAAGSICWELAHLGLPALALVVAGNQEGLAAGLDRAGVLHSLGWHDRIDDAALSGVMTRFLTDPSREAMSRRGRALVDGAGASRVLDAMAAVERSSARDGAMA